MQCFSNWNSKAGSSVDFFLEHWRLEVQVSVLKTESTKASLKKKENTTKQFSTENYKMIFGITEDRKNMSQ